MAVQELLELVLFIVAGIFAISTLLENPKNLLAWGVLALAVALVLTRIWK